MPGYHDIIVGAKTRIDEPHEQTHKGLSFTTTIVDSIMADGDTLIVAFRTGDKEIHLTYDLNVAWGGDISFCEDPTWDAGTGTPTEIINRNRKFDTVSTLLTEEDGTAGYVTANPNNYACNYSKLTSIRIGILWFFKPTDLSRSRHNREYVLKENTNYGIQYTAAVAQDAWWATDAAQILLDWYEINNRYD